MVDLSIAGLSMQAGRQPLAVQVEQTAIGGDRRCVSAQEFAVQTLQSGGISALLSGQGLIANYDGVGPTLVEPLNNRGRISAEHKCALNTLVGKQKIPVNEHKLDLMAASASKLILARIILEQQNKKRNEIGKVIPESITDNVVAQNSEGDASAKYLGDNSSLATTLHIRDNDIVNLIGDMNLVEIQNMLNKVLLNEMIIYNKSSGKAIERMVKSASYSGDKSIEAAKERRNGAITAGIMGGALQGAFTAFSVKALRKEANSIGNNLGKANQQELNLRINQSAIKKNFNDIISDGNSRDKTVQSVMSGHDHQVAHNISTLRDQHSIVQNKTQKVRAMAEYANQVTYSGKNAIEKAFDVAGSIDSKQAELARADQSVNNESSNTHIQTARKANDIRTALNQALEAALSVNNSAVSSIAEHLR